MRDSAPAGPDAGQFGPDIYTGWRGSSLGEITEALEHRLLFRLTGALKARSVLDVGCGDGTLAATMLRAGATRVVGCDPDPRMIARARTQTLASAVPVDFLVARSQALPFPDRCFDVVTCVTVLTFVPEADRAVSEMARVLRPGGHLVIGDLGKWSIWAARRRVRGWFGAPMWRAARFRTARELAALAARAGLIVSEIKGAIFFPPATALARWVAPIDPALGDVTTFGAAFVAMRATKVDPAAR
jgi:ubiquinone/menaquinone biosynthesis C-methylase UbiE